MTVIAPTESLSESITSPGSEPDPRRRPPDLLSPGDWLDGHYEIRRLLGTGGMGQVYEARDHELNRLVAIKLSWPDVGPAALRREAQVLAAFRVPSLPTAYALCKHEGMDFLVLELLRGVLLSDHLQRSGALAPVEAVDLLVSVCEALFPIHESGLAHCDLKPTNIMLVGGRVVLFDFGIVRMEQDRTTRRPITGTAHYMAPEVIRGDVVAGEAHLVDIYALGILAFVLLTARPPYQHARTIDIMSMHLHDPLPHVRDHQPGISTRLDAIVAAMMAKRADERPSRVDELRVDLIAAREQGSRSAAPAEGPP
jgi:eukaryotic-like serine/threonine-protein kinase